MTYWMHIGPDLDVWYVYRVNPEGEVHMLTFWTRIWEKSKHPATHPQNAKNYTQVPDSIVVVMGLPL